MKIRTIIVGTMLCVLGALVLPGGSQGSSQFEVASIKRNTTSDPRIRQLGLQPGGRLIGINAPVKLLIQNAYQLRPFQVLGGPGWIDSDGYDIDARPETGSVVTPRQTFTMLQGLLEDRFKFQSHRETRELPVYLLQVAKGGPKLQPPKDGNCVNTNTPGPPTAPPTGPPRTRCGTAGVSIGPQGTRLFGGQISVTEFMRVLSIVLGRSVIDKTGFTGTFDVDLAFLPDQAVPGLPNPGPGLLRPPDPTAVTIFTAIQEQLGLNLESAKGPVEVMVIDHVERPSEN